MSEAVLNSLKCLVDRFGDQLAEHELVALKRAIEWATADCFADGAVHRLATGIHRAGPIHYERSIRRRGRQRFMGGRWTYSTPAEPTTDEG